jgi:hypothetical protein
MDQHGKKENFGIVIQRKHTVSPITWGNGLFVMETIQNYAEPNYSAPILLQHPD